MVDEKLQRLVWNLALREEGDADALAEQELEYGVAQLQDLRCQLEQVARGAEVYGARLPLSRAKFLLQPFERVFIQHHPALARVVAISANVAVHAVVKAAGREADRREHGEAGQAGRSQYR
jgi:hypothetical protein